MQEEYDFSKAKKNPYTKHEKKQVTINLDETAIAYFRSLAEQTGVPYQTLINMYLCDCARRKLTLTWTT